MPIPALPPDIIFMILDNLDFKERRKFLEVCSDWRVMFLRKVFGKITIDSDEGLVPLAHIIRLNRLFASTVRELRIPNLLHGETAGRDGLYKRRDLINGARFIPGVPPPKDQILPEYQFVEVLLGLENLRYLEARHHSYRWNFTVRALVEIAPMIVPSLGYKPLSHLEEVHFLSTNAFGVFLAVRFAPFFTLPSMRVFRVTGLYEVGNTSNWYKNEVFERLNLSPGSSPVRKIILEHSNCTTGLEKYITACSNLEHFEYSHLFRGGRTTYDVEDFKPRRFHQALSTQRHSLRFLSLNSRGIPMGVFNMRRRPSSRREEDLSIRRWFGDLSTFTELRELRIPTHNLLNLENGQPVAGTYVSLAKILPPGLEFLFLARTEKAEFNMVVGAICELLRVRRERFPGLRKLEVEILEQEIVWEVKDGTHMTYFHISP